MSAGDGGAVALGFAPHSGWAVLVAIAGGAARPEVVLRARIEMADPNLQGSKQPYHEVEGLALLQAQRRLERYLESAQSLAFVSLFPIVADLRKRGYAPKAAGILDSSGNKGGSLESTLASHALIHTADGEHFREALARATTRCELIVQRVRGRELLDQASRALGKKAQHVQASVQALGRSLGPPWDADHKSAALLAWLMLADETKTGG